MRYPNVASPQDYGLNSEAVYLHPNLYNPIVLSGPRRAAGFPGRIVAHAPTRLSRILEQVDRQCAGARGLQQLSNSPTAVITVSLL
jgi:hypothetical protein